jgi:hypothetical protein
MNLYPWIVLVHVSGMTLFFIAHGAPAMVSLRLRSERDPARVLALLDLARWSMGRTAGIALLVGFLAGIVAGFVGGWWGHLWIWLALAIFVGVSLAMTPLTPMTEAKLHQMRRAGGIGIESPFGISGRGEAPPADPEELQRLLAAWNPVPTAVLGFGGFIAILALMLLKPL